MFIYLFLAALGLCWCTWAFSSCSEWGATPHCGAWASHCSGFSCCGARALGMRASVVVAHRLSSCSARVPLLQSWCWSFVSSLFIFVSLDRSLLILLISSKDQLLVSLIFLLCWQFHWFLLFSLIPFSVWFWFIMR